MKDNILRELINNKNRYLSGQELSAKFGISRTAIWKHINKLKEEGYVIESATNKGYVLIESPDILNPVEIKELLKTKFIGRDIIYLDSVDSTNSYGKRMAEGDFWDGTVIIAEEQTSGRGRLGRDWVSPKGKGIWMTIMLKPDIKPNLASQVTLIAAVAVLKAIKSIYNMDIMIKWPNDLVVNGKKVCGILTELGAEIERINYLCVGIGINANSEESDFINKALDTATSIKIATSIKVERKELIARILTVFENYYSLFLEKGSIGFMIEEYKKYLINIGKEVRLITKNEEIQAKAEDITNEGHLLVRLKDGTLKEISSGEVSVRGIYGYV
ncbi:biotin--[acetyl-CoA-carboxylase] ligase [Lutispora sp.]|uniref:biotin--[acetyl-CoA-carboxylase] ligase n=1 Tax=Lutispora sp. TaxID=2828727 RepID=UPI003563C85B